MIGIGVCSIFVLNKFRINMTPMIFIIVPCYNQAKYMREALDSVLASTLSDWECIIVNDGSKDATIDIAREYGGNRDAQSRNAKGKYFML